MLDRLEAAEAVRRLTSSRSFSKSMIDRFLTIDEEYPVHLSFGLLKSLSLCLFLFKSSKVVEQMYQIER